MGRLSETLPGAQATSVKNVQSVFGSSSFVASGRTPDASPLILYSGSNCWIGFLGSNAVSSSPSISWSDFPAIP